MAKVGTKNNNTHMPIPFFCWVLTSKTNKKKNGLLTKTD